MGKACSAHERGCDQNDCPACILKKEKEQIRSALQELMDAHRAVFRTSIFTAFASGKTTFINAWKNAERFTQHTEKAVKDE